VLTTDSDIYGLLNGVDWLFSIAIEMVIIRLIIEVNYADHLDAVDAGQA
jgi:hypothetical protein